MPTASTSYIHGTSSTEQRRLSSLNDLINEACLREMALRGDERIIDFGCGLMQFTRMMARAANAPDGATVGIEREAQQRVEGLAQATLAGEASRVDLRGGDAADPPLRPHEWGTFDVAHARFLLEHVTDPRRVVTTMVRTVKPGGRLVLADDDHDTLRLWPAVPAFDRVWRAYMETYSRGGNDPIVGRRLVSLLHDAGAVPIRNTFLFFGSCAGHETWELITRNLERILEGARESILATELANGPEFEQAVGDLRSWFARPDAALWYSICWAEGRRPQ